MPVRKNVYRCPECRTPRKSWDLFVKHCLTCPRKTCSCGGYPYTHRPGSPCCEQHPRATLYRAERAGATPEQLADLRLELALAGVGGGANTTDPPF